MRSLLFLLALVFTIGSLALPLAAHAAIPFFGPIVPDTINRCAAGWGAVIDIINRIISFLITIAIVFIAPLMIAYAGFLYVVNPVNASGISEAKKILTNTVVGIVIALAGWLIVDAIMAVLYNANTPNPTGGGVLGTWSNLVTSGGFDPCLIQEGALQNLRQADLSGSRVTGVSASGGRFISLPTNANCSPSTIQQATIAGGYTGSNSLTQAQINTLSCIAVAESSCSNTPPPARQPDGTPTTASGMFQIVFGCQGCDDPCHNLNIPACGNLNCNSAFRGGLPAPGKEAEAAACQRAAANITCNASAAACLVQANGGRFDDWTRDLRASTQRNCITQYASLR